MYYYGHIELKTLVLLMRCGMGKVRDRFGEMGMFKVWLRCKGWVNSVIIHVITEIDYTDVITYRYF